MDQQPNQPAPASPAPAPQPMPTESPKKSTPVWAWVLGGCLIIIVLTMIAMGGFAWWAAKKVKNELQHAQPKLEQWQKDAEKMQKQAEDWQKQAEKMQNQIPAVPDNSAQAE